MTARADRLFQIGRQELEKRAAAFHDDVGSTATRHGTSRGRRAPIVSAVVSCRHEARLVGQHHCLRTIAKFKL